MANFWRALQAAPEEVTRYADRPVNEADPHAIHRWLVSREEFRDKMHSDKDYFDPEIAGLWVWGICCWIGSGWCTDAGSRQRPHLGDAGMGVHRYSLRSSGLAGYLQALSARLRYVRVCCGDWSRVLGPSQTTKLGLTAVFLDPPYAGKAGRDRDLYAVEDLTVSEAVRAWALEHGDDPKLRIALCGYEGEHEMPETWECVAEDLVQSALPESGLKFVLKSLDAIQGEKGVLGLALSPRAPFHL